MKKLLLLSTLLLIFATSFAQNGFYLAPTAGLGMGNVSQDFYMSQLPGNRLEKVGILTYNVGLNVGYKLSHWRLEAGLQYGISGFKYDGLLFSSSFPDDTKLGSSVKTYKHLSVPLKLGYEVKLSEKWSLVPYVGLITSYNLGASTTNNIPSIGSETHKWTKDDFENNHNRISLWTTATARLEYSLSKRISIFGGPSVQYMISNLLKPPVNQPNAYDASQRHFNLHLDLGMNIKF